MQRVLGRFAAHFLGAAARSSGDLMPAGSRRIGRPPRLGLVLVRVWERWVNESSPQLLGEEKTQDVLVIGFFAAFSLIGWLMLLQGYAQLREAQAIERWPTVEGTIVAVDLQPVGGREGTRWRPQVTYAYAVRGHVITATRVTPRDAPSINNEIQARRYVRTFLPQTPVKVYYNPAEITESVLAPAAPRSASLNLLLGAGLACLGPALFLMVGMPASRRRGWLLWQRPRPGSRAILK